MMFIVGEKINTSRSSIEEAVEKIGYGSDKQSRIDYWTMRLKRDNK